MNLHLYDNNIILFFIDNLTACIECHRTAKKYDIQHKLLEWVACRIEGPDC